MKSKSKIPVLLRTIRWVFPKIELIAPRIASFWAWKLFLTPFRFTAPKVETDFGKMASQFELKLMDKKIIGYEWGRGERTILVMHGWSGRATQFRKIIEKFNERGFRVIGVDGPAHGKSSGKTTDIFEFVEVLKQIKLLYPEIDSIITHSFGGVASIRAIREGLEINTIVNLGTPTDSEYTIAEFMKRINGSIKIGNRFKQNVINKYNMPFSEASVKENLKHIKNIDLLMIHDTMDKEVPVKHAIDLHAEYPFTKLIITNGLGHMRILKNDVVIEHCLNFIMKEETVTI